MSDQPFGLRRREMFRISVLIAIRCGLPGLGPNHRLAIAAFGLCAIARSGRKAHLALAENTYGRARFASLPAALRYGEPGYNKPVLS